MLGLTIWVIGEIVQCSSYSYGQFVAGRFIAGFGTLSLSYSFSHHANECRQRLHHRHCTSIPSGVCQVSSQGNDSHDQRWRLHRFRTCTLILDHVRFCIRWQCFRSLAGTNRFSDCIRRRCIRHSPISARVAAMAYPYRARERGTAGTFCHQRRRYRWTRDPRRVFADQRCYPYHESRQHEFTHK